MSNNYYECRWDIYGATNSGKTETIESNQGFVADSGSWIPYFGIGYEKIHPKKLLVRLLHNCYMFSKTLDYQNFTIKIWTKDGYLFEHQKLDAQKAYDLLLELAYDSEVEEMLALT